MSDDATPAKVQLSEGLGRSRSMTRTELVAALRLVGDSMGGACAQAADMLEAEGRIKLLPGDYFTHDRTGARFVCRAVTRHDYGGLQSVVRAEVDLAA
jgi:hypothetical protein